jgi:hypothetical protein
VGGAVIDHGVDRVLGADTMARDVVDAVRDGRITAREGFDIVERAAERATGVDLPGVPDVEPIG